MTLVICGKTSQTVRSHRNYLYKAFSTLVEREKLSPCEAAVSELYRTFNRPTQYIQETKLRRSDRHFTCSGLSDISRRTETSGKWMSWGKRRNWSSVICDTFSALSRTAVCAFRGLSWTVALWALWGTCSLDAAGGVGWRGGGEKGLRSIGRVSRTFGQVNGTLCLC